MSVLSTVCISLCSIKPLRMGSCPPFPQASSLFDY